MRSLLIIASMLILSACAPATLQGLRASPEGDIKIRIDEAYQPVYRKILSNARRCYQGGLITAQMVVQGDLYTDTQSAEITVALHGAAGINTYLGVDINALDEKTTTVHIFYALPTWKASAIAIEKWVKNNSSDCQQP